MRKKNKIFLAAGFSIVVICLLISILQSQTQKRQELSKKEEQQKAEQMLQKRYSCEGKIELVGKDIRLNLKSKLAQYFSMAELFSGGEPIEELELLAYKQEDVEKLMNFMING